MKFLFKIYQMYVVRRGKLNVVSDDGKKVFATLGAGTVFGEVRSNTHTQESYRATYLCPLIILYIHLSEFHYYYYSIKLLVGSQSKNLHFEIRPFEIGKTAFYVFLTN